jgi:predicted nucleic acid-binding protein
VGALILDASVLIGLLDSTDVHHSRAVDDVERADRAGRPLLAPASAYSEALVAFARVGRVLEAREAIAAMGTAITPLTATIAETWRRGASRPRPSATARRDRRCLR